MLRHGAVFLYIASGFCGSRSDIRCGKTYYVYACRCISGHGCRRIPVLFEALKENKSYILFSPYICFCAVGTRCFRSCKLYHRTSYFCDFARNLLFCNEKFFTNLTYCWIFDNFICALEYILFFIEFLHNFIELNIEKNAVLLYNKKEF